MSNHFENTYSENKMLTSYCTALTTEYLPRVGTRNHLKWIQMQEHFFGHTTSLNNKLGGFIFNVQIY